jgi:hypothetical protein
MKYIKLYEKYKESDVDDILDQISDFLKSNMKNTWIGNDSISIYIRKSKRLYNNNMLDFFDFATIDVVETGNGLFTQIIKQFEELYPNMNIFIESVLTDRFASYIKNNLGFEEILPNPSNNFYKIKNNK